MYINMHINMLVNIIMKYWVIFLIVKEKNLTQD